MKIAVGSDHAGFALKEELKKFLSDPGYEVTDCGNAVLDPGDDYPDSARAVAVRVARGDAERGIVICGSGVGASVAANKVPGVRCALCHDTFSARQGVQDDAMNVLALGERVIGPSLARDVVNAFLGASFSGLPRHARRLDKVLEMEKDARAGSFDFLEVKK